MARAWPDAPLTAQNIHKYAPVSVREGFDWVRSKSLSRILDLLPQVRRDKIAAANVLAHASAPVYWCHPYKTHCADNEWFYPLISKRYLRVRREVPFLVLGAGSCQRYYSDGSEFMRCNRCLDYSRQIHHLASVTVVRDSLAKNLLMRLGLRAALLPCPSIFVREQFGLEPSKPSYVCLNYMWGGGHYELDQKIHADRWEASFKEFYMKISQDHRCVFVCHNRREVREVRRIAPGSEAFYSNDYQDYARFYAGASCGVVNRVHAAYALASFGRPSFLVGADSRAQMADVLGLHRAFVNEVDSDILLEEFNSMVEDGAHFAARIRLIKDNARQQYVATLRSAADIAGAGVPEAAVPAVP